MSIEAIEAEESKQCEAFAKWRVSQGIALWSQNERDLQDYVYGLLREVADLKAELYHLKGNA